MTNLRVCWHKSIDEIKELDWQKLLGKPTIPFYEWKWLNALEKSGSVSNEKGWQPLHLSLWRKSSLIALAPLYLKNHSYGEFIFDHAFNRLAESLGLNYYPKLIGMSPFSPVEGYRFFIAPGEDQHELTFLIMNQIDSFALRNGILSCNFLYVDPTWCPLAKAVGYAAWFNQQSLWSSDGKKDFSEYLENFNANQRRNIRRERQAIKDIGLSISAFNGREIDKEMMQEMYNFYHNHCSRWGPWGSKYLSESFFQSLAEEKKRNQLVLFIAHDKSPREAIAMSLCITNGEKLWGRYWGSKEEINHLHFEVCYYSPIEWALAKGIHTFDPGAGGAHKRRRGFKATPTVSLHKWYDQRMDNLIRAWLPEVNKMMLHEIEASNNGLPFKIKPPQLSFSG